MMYRAFVPLRAPTASDLDAFPSWLVSFDGQRFIEVVEKPEASNASLLRSLWSVVVDGPRKRRRGDSGLILTDCIQRELVERFGEGVEEIPEPPTIQKVHLSEGEPY